jgi:acyl transferase domain-containing protein/acyl carrier protein
VNQLTPDLALLTPLQRASTAIQELRARLDAANRMHAEPVAIVGMGCRFPGGADTPERFWELLVSERDVITEVPPSRWDAEAWFDPDPEAGTKMYTRLGGFLSEPVDTFAASFFGISPREAAGMDPQQRLLLEVSWEALEHAGIAADRLVGSQTGVYVGTITSDYGMIHPFSQVEPADLPYIGLGNASSFPAGRLSYTFGFQGPSMVVATACSSALVATHLAMQALRGGECTLALAGGVHLMFDPSINVALSRMRALAPDGRCKTFDASADGYGRGEGCGIVVLKRLRDAERDGDTVYAVLRGSAVNHDGASAGLSVPHGPAQEGVIRGALKAAGVRPSEVGYVEAHGTGTPLGDPIEANALDAVMREGRSPGERLLVGSVKTNIAHTEAAAGVAALIKVVLALQHEAIPANLHFNTPSPHLDWDHLCLSVATHLTAWPRGERRRIAGISSFGLSGINAHVIVEEGPSVSPPADADTTRPHEILTLSGKTESALREHARRLAQALADDMPTERRLMDICASATVGRAHFEQRLAVVASSRDELREALTAFAAGSDSPAVRHGRVAPGLRPRVVFVFTGQGSQYANMGRELYETYPEFRRILDSCSANLEAYLKPSLLEVLYGGAATSALLNLTAYTQPALFALEYALAQTWRTWGIEPEAVMGHSVGEYVAACVAGVFSLEDGLRLIAERGRLVQTLPRDGAMHAVFADASHVRELLRPFQAEVAIAAVNGPTHTVISGRRESVQQVVETLRHENVDGRPLQVSHAFHSPLMDPILDSFQQIAETVRYTRPRMCLISNLTGEAVDDVVATPEYWTKHIRGPVLFSAGVSAAASVGCNVLLEVGPQPTLLGMAARCSLERPMDMLPSLRVGRSDWQQMLESLGTLYVRGTDVNWPVVAGRRFRREVLPGYPFERQRFWMTASKTLAPAPSQSPTAAPTGRRCHPLLGARWSSAATIQQFENRISANEPAYLADHRVFGTPIMPGAGFVELALAAADDWGGHKTVVLQDLVLNRALDLGTDPARGVVLQTIVSPLPDNTASLEIFSRSADEDQRAPADQVWTRHASGTLLTAPSAEQAPAPADLPALQAQMTDEVPVISYYERLREQGLEYGPAFRAVDRAMRRDNQTLARIRVPGGVSCEGYHLHPVLLDACLQALGVVLDTSQDDSVLLPVGLERVRVYQHHASEAWAHARYRERLPGADDVLVADLVLIAPEGSLIAEVTGLQFKRTTRDVLLGAAPDDSLNWLYEVDWQEQPPAALQAGVVADTRRWLLLADPDADGVDVSLADWLRATGDSVDIAVPGLDDEYDRLLSDVRPHAIIWLGSAARRTPDDVEASVERGCTNLLRLVQAVARTCSSRPPALWLLTRGSASVGISADPSRLLQAPLASLGRTIALEFPELHCKVVDLPSSPEAVDVQQLGAELRSNADQSHVALRDGARWTWQLVRRRPLENQTLKLSPDATYLISGGLGGLGMEVARWLVDRGAQHLVLMGRRGAQPDAEERLDALRDLGAEIHVVRGDVAQATDVARMLESIDSAALPLRGIIHAAGVLDDGILLQQTPERFARVLAPKVAGAWNLHRATLESPLDFFVLFSSAIALAGRAGLANYAAANAFLDALAHYRQALGLPAQTINWSAWSGVGMAATIDADIPMISPGQGTALLEQAMLSEASQVVILPPEASHEKAHPGQPAAQLRSQLESLPADARREVLTAHVRLQVRRVLRLQEAEELDEQHGFKELGMDSLMSIELRNALQQSLSCSLPATVAFVYPTVADLADHLLRTVVSQPDPESTDMPVPAADAAENQLEDVLAVIDQLSDQQVRDRILTRQTAVAK